MSETLKKQQQIMVPPELNSKLETLFQNSVNSVRERVVGIHDEASMEIKNVAKKQLESQHEDCEIFTRKNSETPKNILKTNLGRRYWGIFSEAYTSKSGFLNPFLCFSAKSPTRDDGLVEWRVANRKSEPKAPEQTAKSNV